MAESQLPEHPPEERVGPRAVPRACESCVPSCVVGRIRRECTWCGGLIITLVCGIEPRVFHVVKISRVLDVVCTQTDRES